MIREEFITASEIALEKLMTPLKELPEELMDEPIAEGKWSVKQMILHLAYWDIIVVRALEALFQDSEFDWSQFEEADNFNATVIEGRQHESYRRIATEFQIVHGTIIAAVERIPLEKFGDSGELPDWLTHRVPDHYMLHVPIVETWAKKIRDSGRGGMTGLPVVQT
jgi:hypothetical protein